MKFFLKFKKALISLILISLSYVIFVSADIYLYGSVDERTKADAAVVLGAAVWENEPSPVFEERINHAIWLYMNGYVDKLILTGGKTETNDYSESSIAKQYAINKSVPSGDILIEEESKITQENIWYAGQIVEQNNLSSVIIVSDPLHMKRAMLMARDYGLTAYSSPTPTTQYRSLQSKIPFWAREVVFLIGYRIYRLFK